MRMNKKGQFTIIAALLVTVILIGTVVSTYSAIRYSSTKDQPQVLSSVDEINLTLRQLLGFTLGYYGSVLQVTGNTTYAQNITKTYLNSGLVSIANTKPELGVSFNVTSIDLQVEWFGTNSYSSGKLNVTYDLAGLGFYGLKYSPVCKLEVNILPTVAGVSRLIVTQDEDQPLNTLTTKDFGFYRYLDTETWDLTSPNSIEEVTLGGTYSIIVPSGVDSNSYFVQVEDARGITVVASSYTHFTSTSAWSLTRSTSSQDFVDQLSNVDSSLDKGYHSNFNNQLANDNNNDSLTELNTGTNTEQYVTLQSSNVDGSTDKGTHSSFNNQKAKDSLYDTLTEQNSGANSEQFVTQTSNVDGSADTGGHSSFNNQKAKDNTFDALTEVNIGSQQSTFGSSSGTSSYTTVSASRLYGSVFTSPANSEGATVQNIIWYGRTGSGSGNAKAILVSATTKNIIAVSSSVSVSTTAQERTCVFASPPTIQANTAYVLMMVFDVSTRLYYASGTNNQGYLDTSNSYANPSNPTDATNNNNQYYVRATYQTPANYVLDLEEQFTGVDFSQTNEWLCIYAGNLGSESLKVDVYSGGAWVPLIPVLAANQWNNVSVSTYLTSATFTIRFKGAVESGDSVQDTWNVDAVLLKTGSVNYVLDLEEQFTGVDFSQTNEWLCIYAGNLGSESLRVDVWSGSGWVNVISGLLPNQWNNVSVSTWLTGVNFTIRFNGGTETGDITQDTWNIDAVIVHTWTVNYVLDLEEQFTGVDFSQTNEWLCIYAGNLGSESLRVDVWSGSGWVNVISGLLPNQWNNVSVSTWLTGVNFTIRFNGGTETGDITQDTWNIDAVLLNLNSVFDPIASLQDSTIVVEWLQNGTLRRMGQNLNLTTTTKPIPPIPVKAIHISQTFVNGTNMEVPFQVEDWASNYSIPLGLTNNATVFSNKQMLVYLLDKSVSETTIWWNGSDQTAQTPKAFSNVYFTGDNQASNRITNGRLTLDFGGGFTLTSTAGGTTSTTSFMRINSEASVYGASPAYVIHHGVVRDIVQQEAEWNDGANNCPNLYANIVITLPARANYYTYQLRLMFLNSAQDRTINDLCPIKVASAFSPIQTEDGVSNWIPTVSMGNGTYYNSAYPSVPGTAHHWSQCVSGSSGTGILFTDSANKALYAFDTFVGSGTGAIKTTSTSTGTIELLPVTRSPANHYNNALDITWSGAVATFSSTATPVYDANGGNPTGLWVLAEYQPTIAVAAGT